MLALSVAAPLLYVIIDSILVSGEQTFLSAEARAWWFIISIFTLDFTLHY